MATIDGPSETILHEKMDWTPQDMPQTTISLLSATKGLVQGLQPLINRENQ